MSAQPASLAPTLASMTGYGRATGHSCGHGWVWEVKSVNGRGLELRWRLPAGWDDLEADGKALASRVLARGSVTLTLTLVRDGTGAAGAVDGAALAAALALIDQLVREHGLARPSAADVLALDGVMSGRGALADDARAQLRVDLLAGLGSALDALVASRRAEGARLGAVLSDGLDAIENTCRAALAAAATQPAALQERLRQRLADLLGVDHPVDPGRLAQEVALLAVKADVREELDRLDAHVAAGRALLAKAEPIGRAFDFLAQEFNREANTVCSKASVQELTRLGLLLKSQIDQVREQVQNLE